MAVVERAHLSLADDASVDAVLEPHAEGMRPACWIIDPTTTAPHAPGDRARRWVGRGTGG